jgi:hypothetical protein
VALGNNVFTIGMGAFSGTGLGSVVIPDSVTDIGTNAFDGCISLTNVTVGNGVISIELGAFANCASLASVYFQGSAPSAGFSLFIGDSEATVYYLPGTTGWGTMFAGRPAVPFIPTPFTHAATATAIVTNGFFVWAALTDGGYGYTNTPTVRIIGGGGSGAQAAAVVSNGVVIAVNVLGPGSGYSGTPTVVIAPPFIANPTIGISPFLAFNWPVGTQALELDIGSLSPYDNYQLQFAPGARGTWTNAGLPFIPAAATNTQYVYTVGNVGFFRVIRLP